MASFIVAHMEEILLEWDEFAVTLTPAADTMNAAALRDHARQMLEAIAKDIETAQSPQEQELKSKGLAPAKGGRTAAAAHGQLRQQGGFDLRQLVAEFRALRASVLRIWLAAGHYEDAPTAHEIARFNEAIDQALGESVATYSAELAKSRDTFLGILGHDLRSPLGALWGAMEVLANSGKTPARDAAYAAGKRSLASMQAMIGDLLDFTRTRLGKGIPIAPATADLANAVKASVEEMALAYPRSTFTLSDAGPIEGAFDGERMRQVISNLLGNAVQHGEPDAEVVVRTGSDEEAIWVTVTNEGPAIPAEDLTAIFEPMVSLALDGTEPTANMGLGLFIAREIVLAHGGKITASSSPASGTTFSVSLPRARVPVAA